MSVTSEAVRDIRFKLACQVTAKSIEDLRDLGFTKEQVSEALRLQVEKTFEDGE